MRGDSTLVDTTVAMELAASWNPLITSKTRASAIVKYTTSKEELISFSQIKSQAAAGLFRAFLVHTEERRREGWSRSDQEEEMTTPSIMLATFSQRSTAFSKRSKISFHLMIKMG